MQNNSAIEVGKVYPNKNYHVKGDYAVSIITSSFLDLLVSMCDIDKEEVKAFKDKLILGLYVNNNVPFLILYNPAILVSCSINAHALNEQDRKKWLMNDGNICSIFLLDGYNHTVKVIRTLGICEEITNTIRQVLAQQLEHTTNEEVVKIIEHTMSTHSDKELLSSCCHKQIFHR